MSIPISKNPKSGISPEDIAFSRLQGSGQEAQLTFCIIDKDYGAGQYYNPKSNIIALKYNKHTYWAFLIGNQTLFPTPDTYDLLWIRNGKVNELPANEGIPDTLPDDMYASMAFLIPKKDQPNPIYSTSTAPLTGGFTQDSEVDSIMYHGKRASDPSKRTGMHIGRKTGNILLKGGDAEITMAGGTINLDGKFSNTDMGAKSVFSENPLAFIIPSTITTFPFAYDYLPDFEMIEEIADTLGIVDTITEIADIFSDLF